MAKDQTAWELGGLSKPEILRAAQVELQGLSAELRVAPETKPVTEVGEAGVVVVRQKQGVAGKSSGILEVVAVVAFVVFLVVMGVLMAGHLGR